MDSVLRIVLGYQFDRARLAALRRDGLNSEAQIAALMLEAGVISAAPAFDLSERELDLVSRDLAAAFDITLAPSASTGESVAILRRSGLIQKVGTTEDGALPADDRDEAPPSAEVEPRAAGPVDTSSPASPTPPAAIPPPLSLHTPRRIPAVVLAVILAFAIGVLVVSAVARLTTGEDEAAAPAAAPPHTATSRPTVAAAATPTTAQATATSAAVQPSATPTATGVPASATPVVPSPTVAVQTATPTRPTSTPRPPTATPTRATATVTPTRATATVTPTRATATATPLPVAGVPKPQLTLRGTSTDYCPSACNPATGGDGIPWVKYDLRVTNANDFPDDFLTGKYANCAPPFHSIRNADTGVHIYGGCGGSDDAAAVRRMLTDIIWFAVKSTLPPPRAVVLVLTDTDDGRQVVSDALSIPDLR